MKMRVADYLTDALYRAGGETVFMVTGGMIMHLTDALLVHGKQKWISCHHEQAAVMAADAYGRYTDRLGVAYVTAGPGALNTLTGVVGAYVDSAPCVIVAGQSKVSQASVTGPRQFALQGFNTLPIFEQVTKYAVTLDDVESVRYKVERAIYEAKVGRPGPVWIEVPVDIQGTSFDPDDYEGFTPEPDPAFDADVIVAAARQVAQALRASTKPALLAGAGVRIAGAVDELLALAHDTGIPVLTSRLGMDLIGFDDPAFVGRPGTYGDRPGNFTVMHCDLLLTIGCRLALGLVGHDFKDFAAQAVKVMVDVDEEELDKVSSAPDIRVRADALAFIRALRAELGDFRVTNDAWLAKVAHWKAAYPVDVSEYADETEGINSYHFMRLFSERTAPDDVFVLDTGSCFHVHAQAFRVKQGQRHVVTGGLSTMGFMPAVMGPAVVRPGKSTYCVTGDGSIMMNLQELQTIHHSGLPVKLIILNNNGYLLIRHTQTNFEGGRLIGESEETGVSFPDFAKVADTWGFRHIRLDSLADFDAKVGDFIGFDGPAILEVMTPSWQLLIPRVASKQLEDGSMMSMPYDDMFPFLERDVYEAETSGV
jgi:acetolactate synthase-1/2/3 large subunit